MFNIEKLEGLDKHLYELVAPLVMNPEVLKQNKNYPFKTSKKHLWFVALEDNITIGFLPIEIRDRQAIINNYYTKDESQEILSSLIKKAVEALEEDYFIVSVTQSQHIETFLKQGFTIEREWKNYVRMRKAE